MLLQGAAGGRKQESERSHRSVNCWASQETVAFVQTTAEVIIGGSRNLAAATA